MLRIKKALLITCVVLLIINIAVISFAVETGKATEDAKLRKTTSTDSTILEIIPKGEDVEILEKDGEWYKVKYNKIRGYVQMGYLDVPENIKTESTETENTESTSETNVTISEEVKEGNIVKAKMQGKLLIRPVINAIEVSEVKKDDNVSIMQILNDWAYVSINNVNGWIRVDLLKNADNSNKTESNKKAYVTTKGTNFREGPNTSSKILGEFSQNSEVTILGEVENWYNVEYNGQTGYVSKNYVSDTKVTTSRSSSARKTTKKITTTTSTANATQNKETASVAKVEEVKPVAQTNTSSSKGQEVANYAKKYVGYKYVYGGTTPSGGFDCSGFTMYVYKQFGVSLPRTSSSQATKGTKVSKSNLQPGDLVFFKDFSTNKGIGHVGIYIGNNQFVHASTAKSGVKISSLNTSTYLKRYVTAVRFF